MTQGRANECTGVKVHDDLIPAVRLTSVEVNQCSLTYSGIHQLLRYSVRLRFRDCLLDQFIVSHTDSAQRRGERWRRATSARIRKRVPPAAIRPTEKLELIC